MRESRNKLHSGEEFKDPVSLSQKKTPFTLKFFIKDIELSRRDFVLYFLMFSTLLLFLFGQFVLESLIIELEGTEFVIYTYAIIGLFLGLLVSMFFNDRIKNPLKTIYYIIIFSIFTSVVQGLLLFLALFLLLRILIIVNTFVIFVGTMLYFKLFLIKTTVLERGRIWTYFFALLFIETMIFVLAIFFIFFAIIPVILLIATVVFLHFNLKKSEIILGKPTTKRKGLGSNIDVIKYLLFYVSFGLTAGFATSAERFNAVADQAYGGDIILILFILFSGIAAAILMGIIFDFTGRTGTMSFILFTIALATYSNVFQFTSQFLSDGLVFVSSVAGFISVILIVGDIATRENISKLISIFYIFYGAGLLIGILLRMMIIAVITDIYFSNLLILGTTFMACVICYIFLVNIRETLPRKENEWRSFLHHLYITHKSGILLFDKSFLEEDIRVDPDLVSGSLIGIKTILEEISRGEKPIRTIDHGDRVLIFKTSPNSKVIFTLVAKEELIVLRKKIDSLIEEFDQKYLDLIKEMSAVNLTEFKELKNIVRKYFGS